MPHTAVTQVNSFTVTVTLPDGLPAAALAAIEKAAVLAAKRMGHRSVRSVVSTDGGATVIHLDGLTPAKGMFVTAAEVRGVVDARLARLG